MRGSPPELAQVPSVSTPQPIPETHGPVSVIRGGDDRPAGKPTINSAKGGSMNRMLLAVAGLVAFVSGAPDTWAFTTQPVTSDTMSNRGPTPGQDVEGAIRRNYFRSTRRSPDAAVFCTTVERNLEQPIC